MSQTNRISHLCVAVSILFVAGLAGCGRPNEPKPLTDQQSPRGSRFSRADAREYEPKPLTAEQEELKQTYSQFKDALSRAMGQAGDYVQVAVVDRSTTFPENEQQYMRILVLHREQLDLEDYGFSPPGKERSESESDDIEGFFSDVMFWTDEGGNITFDDVDQPPGTHMVAEWCVPNGSGDKVSLHFGGNPCVILDLTAR